jgi:hypothetical protein
MPVGVICLRGFRKDLTGEFYSGSDICCFLTFEKYGNQGST